MTRERLILLLRVLRALGSTKTTYGLLGLYAVVCGVLWLVSHGWIAPDGSVDLRLWINGNIVNVPKFHVGWLGSGLAALPLGFGLYGRAVAQGPILDAAKALSPEAALFQALLQSADPRVESPSPEDRPEPVVLKPAAGGLGVTVGGANDSRGGVR